MFNSLASVPAEGTQLSKNWLNGLHPDTNPSNLTRIQYAAGSAKLGNQIMTSNPIRILANIKPDGTLTYYQLTVNSDGTVTNNNIIFNP